MSDNAVHLVAVDVSAEDAPRVGEQAARWLRQRGVSGAPVLVDRHIGNPFTGPAAIKTVREHL